MKTATVVKWVACAACAIVASGAFGRNIVKNADLSMTDGLGGVVGWSVRKEDGCSAEAHPVGGGVVSVTFKGPQRSYFRQTPLKLQSGGKFRLSVDVRTAGLGGSKVQAIVWDSGWHTDVGTPPFPEDTKGEWRTMEWTGEIMRNSNPSGYTIALAGDGGSSGTVQLEVRNLMLEPLTPEAEAVSTGCPDYLFDKLVARIVPIDPLLAQVRAANAEMTFYWPGEPECGVAACTLLALLDGGSEKSVKLGSDGRAKVSFGKVALGEHRVAVSVTSPDGAKLAENSYRIKACTRPPKGPEGRRLNNFVTELVNQPLADGEVRFFRPASGWVWISFGETDARGWLDGCAVPLVRKRCGERFVEAVREVAAGWHTLKIAGAAGGGTLRIHAIKTVAMTMWPLKSGPCRFSRQRYHYSFGFSRRFMLPGMNTANGATVYLQNQYSEEPRYYAERGFRIFGGVGINFASPAWLDSEAQWKKLTEGEWRNGYDVSVDESAIGAQRLQHVIFAENVWKMVEMRPAQRVNMYWGDATENWYNDPKVHASELLAMANSGDGRGLVLPETYAPVLRKVDDVEKYMSIFAKQVKSIGEIAPAAKDMTVFNVSPWIDFGHWSDYPYPESDIKAHYAWMIHAFATRPEFAANSGIAAGAANAGEEEIRRWIARLFRYHAIEGGSENLAEKFGYRWTPGFVKNCDFAEGLAGWDALPAEPEAVKEMKIERYGVRIQRRKKVPNEVGEGVAAFTSSAKGANRLSQKVTGLEPGKLYALMFCAPNLENVNRATAEPLPLAFSARLDGAEEIEGLRFRHVVACRYIPKGSKPKETLFLAIYRYVFKAASSEATLVFEDRAADGTALEPGSKQVLNYVIFRPYYTETPEEAQEIADLIAGK